jgi:hypothetical protein
MSYGHAERNLAAVRVLCAETSAHLRREAVVGRGHGTASLSRKGRSSRSHRLCTSVGCDATS